MLAPCSERSRCSPGRPLVASKQPRRLEWGLRVVLCAVRAFSMHGEIDPRPPYHARAVPVPRTHGRLLGTSRWLTPRRTPLAQCGPELDMTSRPSDRHRTVQSGTGESWGRTADVRSPRVVFVCLCFCVCVCCFFTFQSRFLHTCTTARVEQSSARYDFSATVAAR